jgi:serine/threonine protein kinase
MAMVQAPLGGRYRFSRRVQAGTRTIAWLAIDEHTGREVVASPLTGPRFAGSLRALGVEHPHLTTIVDLIKDPDPATLPVTDSTTKVAGVGLATYLPGRTLHEELKGGPLDPPDAVSLVARIAEALAELHSAGAVHGAVSPRSIIIAPSVEHPSPVLTQLMAPTSGAYSAPERLRGHGPSAEDDVWALYATLHASLVAGVPFSGTTREALVEQMVEGNLRQLAEFGVEDAALQQLLTHGLTAQRMHRQSDIKQLHGLLLDWLRTHGHAERASVVSTREEPAVTHTEPPVPVYEDDDQTRVFVRGSVDFPSGLLSEPAAPPPSKPPSAPAHPPPSSPTNAPASSPTNKPASGPKSSPTALAESPLAAMFPAPADADAVKALLQGLPEMNAAGDGTPKRKPRQRLHSMILDPFTDNAFSDPHTDKPAESSQQAARSLAEVMAQVAKEPESASDRAGASAFPAAAPTSSAPAKPRSSEPDQGVMIRLILLAIVIGAAVSTCITLTR